MSMRNAGGIDDSGLNPVASDPTPVEHAAAVTGLGSERAELQREIEGLRALVAIFVAREKVLEGALEMIKEAHSAVEADKIIQEALEGLDPAENVSMKSALVWLDAQRQAARVEERSKFAAICTDLKHEQWYCKICGATQNVTRHGTDETPNRPNIQHTVTCPFGDFAAAIRTPEPAREDGR